MRFDKMFACAAVLGCASAVKVDTTSALEAEALQRRWDLTAESKRVMLDSFGAYDLFEGALTECFET